MRPARAVIAIAAACAAALSISACAGSAGNAGSVTPSAGPAVTGPTYYLSLGDSLAQGVQPNASGASVPTNNGYADRIYAVLRTEQPSLRLVKLGCSGETTHTMIDGGICAYPAGSQLAEAERFLREHRGHVPLVTIDIGANDPNSCFLSQLQLSEIPSCMSESINQTLRDLRTIMAGLRAAGGNATIIAMSYYVPELAGWLDGKTGEEIAVLTERLLAGYNLLLDRIYAHYGARVANVFAAFHSADFTDKVRLSGRGVLPRNVATICTWTWACASWPRGPNEHANDIGYGIIALAFLQADPGLPG
jgi:lysophospholipase L1-like esterase